MSQSGLRGQGSGSAATGSGYLGDYSSITSGTAVKQNQLVTNGGILYSRNADGTISGAFNAANWTAITGGATVGQNPPGAALAVGTTYFETNASSVVIAQWVGTGSGNVKVADLSTQLPGAGLPSTLVAPYNPMVATGNAAAAAINNMRGVRVRIPKTGTLRDLSVFVTTTGGNVIPAVYDDGSASPGNRTRLWNAASVAVGTANAWQVLGDPNLAVTAGQELDLCFQADGVTATFARVAPANGTLTQLPTNFWAAPGGAPPKMAWSYTPGSFAAPASIAEASLINTANAHLIIARIS